jgi:hypothetical protein
MKLKNKEAGNKTTGTDEVQELAQKLDDWAQKELPEKQQTLLRWLLSRCEHREIKQHKDIAESTYVFKTNIEQAVKDALAPLMKSNLPEPTENWPRMGSWSRADQWPRMGDWPRS